MVKANFSNAVIRRTVMLLFRQYFYWKLICQMVVHIKQCCHKVCVATLKKAVSSESNIIWRERFTRRYDYRISPCSKKNYLRRGKDRIDSTHELNIFSLKELKFCKKCFEAKKIYGYTDADWHVFNPGRSFCNSSILRHVISLLGRVPQKVNPEKAYRSLLLKERFRIFMLAKNSDQHLDLFTPDHAAKFAHCGFQNKRESSYI